MAEQTQLQENNISQVGKGLFLDSSLIDQPKGTYRYALNSVNETELGDSGFRSNEESNEICATLPKNYIPIGKVYIGDNNTVIFLVSEDGKTSEIGLVNSTDCTYKTFLNDSKSTLKQKLTFSVEHQIQATYRLRSGCERTIYFTDGYNVVRYFNLDKPNQFKTNGLWDKDKFSLHKSLKSFPTIGNLEVLNNSGNLTPGNYNILIQHLDEDLNGTEFFELVRDIYIYNDATTKNFSDIQGSSNVSVEGSTDFKYPKTSKAISISLNSVDKNFTYIRFAFAERTSGNGQINKVTYSDYISVDNPIFIYTGDNGSTNGTIEEVELYNINSGIKVANHIEQIDNMLMLANTSGDQSNLCKLQSYASKITVDCFVKDTILTNIKEQHNPKNPLVNYNGVGYQPGDIYSLGINYIFEDYSISPTMHIPGKSPDVSESKVFSQENGVYPMSNVNNQNSSERYLDSNSSCDGNYWGVDSENKPLKGSNVRHHRFPTRDKLGLEFVTRSTSGEISQFKQIILSILGIVKISDKDSNPPYVAPNFILTVKYLRNNTEESFSESIYPDEGIKNKNIISNLFVNTDTISNIRLFYTEPESNEVEIPLTDNKSTEQPNGLTYQISIGTSTDNSITAVYKAPIFGLKLSNVQFPSEEEIGKKVIGYQIVRQERTDNDKNILDSAIVFPMQKSGKNVTTGLLAPEFFLNNTLAQSTCEGSEDGTYPTCYNISKRNIMLLTPTHKFLNKTHDGFTTIEQIGTYNIDYRARSATSTPNVYDGTSASGDEDKSTRDDDGFTLRHAYRFTGVKYKPTNGTPLNITNQDVTLYNIEGVNQADTEDNKETLYNLAFDNKALILSSNKADVDLRTYRPNKQEFPYVYIKKDNSTFYQNFRNNPYYLISSEVFTKDTCKVFGGDTFITPHRHSNHVFNNGVAALRRQKQSIWAIAGSIVALIAAVVLSVVTANPGPLLIVGSILVGAGAILTATATILEVAKFSDIYISKWKNNLDKTALDYFTSSLFTREYPEYASGDEKVDPLYLSWADDTFRWTGEIVGDFWFESTINMSLRVQPNSLQNNYLLPLKTYMNDRGDRWYSMVWYGGVEWVKTQMLAGNGFHRYKDGFNEGFQPDQPNESYFVNKITEKDSSRSGGLKYTGYSVPQIYMINPDYFTTPGIKKYYTIPIQYDCCSECREQFPHRIYYSQQSFQEEKSDNYRMFLPNNYKDIEGETGEITNIFRYYNTLYVHTKEALWQMGRNYQERVTDNVVSFIGTGSYFEIPPQKMIDDDTGSSAGSQHKWSTIKTPIGVFFVSANQNKIYQLEGKGIVPISNAGLSNWFKENINIKNTINSDNPSNPNGTGFISVYDSRKERIIFTKLDKSGNTNNSWTLSYSLKDSSWTSWHSYIPSFYINTPDRFFSWVPKSNVLWRHNVIGNYQTFYGVKHPHIIEYVSIDNPLVTKIWNTVRLQTEAKTYDYTLKEYTDERYVTFNKAILYNTRQCSGLMDLKVKNPEVEGVNYMWDQVVNTNTNQSIISRTEKDWYINDFRDIRVNYKAPIWNSNSQGLQTNGYIDKVLNTSTMNINKDWMNLESFRDKYLVIRLIFDTFADKKLITNFSVENEQQSFH